MQSTRLLCCCLGAGPAEGTGTGAAPQQRAAARLARYLLRRTALVEQLMGLLATVPDTFEAARVTGLTIPQAGLPEQVGLAGLQAVPAAGMSGRAWLCLQSAHVMRLMGLLATVPDTF